MIKQTIFISTPRRLSLKNGQMVIEWKDTDVGKVTRPIEDMGCVVLEHQMISVTMPLLNELVKNNVAVILCDSKTMPSAMLQPLEANTTQAETLRLQMDVTEPIKKQAWKQIVEAKINNQAAMLEKYDMDDSTLRLLAKQVKSGDADNREGAAARAYWSTLFGTNFRRERYGDAPNNLLNYGYAILRAAVARALLGSGLLPAIGIFHHNRYNAFPLADDVMEPYRVYVDEAVYSLKTKGYSELDTHAKMMLLKILDCDVTLGKVTRPLQIALTSTTASLVRFYAHESKKLVLPHFK